MVSPVPTIGSTGSVTATKPTTRDSAGFKAALAAATLIEGIISIGDQPSEIGTEEINQLAKGGSVTSKMYMSAPAIELQLLSKPTDAGQIILNTALASAEDFTFSIKTPAATGFSYVGFTAKVVSITKTALDGNSQKLTVSLSVQCPDADPYIAYVPDPPPPPEGD
jgi:hypothetical protein